MTRANLQAEVVRQVLDTGQPIPVDCATVHRWDDETQRWNRWYFNEPLGDQLGPSVPVAPDATSVEFPFAERDVMVQAVLWHEDVPVVSFPPFWWAAGSELRLAPLPMRCTVTP